MRGETVTILQVAVQLKVTNKQTNKSNKQITEKQSSVV